MVIVSSPGDPINDELGAILCFRKGGLHVRKTAASGHGRGRKEGLAWKRETNIKQNIN